MNEHRIISVCETLPRGTADPSFLLTPIEKTLVYRRADDECFLDLCRSHSDAAPSCLLLSGGDTHDARYSYFAHKPYLILQTFNASTVLKTYWDEHHIETSPLKALDDVFNTFHLRRHDSEPVRAFGSFSYDLKNEIEELPSRARDDLHLPRVLLIFPMEVFVHDRTEGTITLQRMIPRDRFGRRYRPVALAREKSTIRRRERVTSNFTRAGYIDAIRKIKQHIVDGDVYQVNLSQRFHAPMNSDPFELWRTMYRMNPAPYYAFIDAGNYHILSTSMERFLRVSKGMIESRPIKGTRPRGRTQKEDDALRNDLLTNSKDDAELSMIVDLVRNDIGRVCLPGSVTVAEHKRLDRYQNVFHLSSTVRGALKSGIGMSDIFRATFPPGSVTGCPKIRAMEIIDELEPHARHVYTGAIGYVSPEEIHLSVAIRTAIATKGQCLFSAGGGIVFDSDEEREYDETLTKAKTFFQALSRTAKREREEV